MEKERLLRERLERIRTEEPILPVSEDSIADPTRDTSVPPPEQPPIPDPQSTSAKSRTEASTPPPGQLAKTQPPEHGGWILGSGEVAFLCAVAVSLMQFYPGLSFLCRLGLAVLGFGIMSVVCWNLARFKAWKKVHKAALVAGGFGIFVAPALYTVIFRPRAEIAVSSVAHNLPHARFSRFGGIDWKASYVDTRVFIKNEGAFVARHLRMMLTLDTQVLGLAEVAIQTRIIKGI